MNLNEIEAREKELNSVILFDESDADITGIEFQRITSDGEPVLCILIDGMKKPAILYGEQLWNLKNFLSAQF